MHHVLYQTAVSAFRELSVSGSRDFTVYSYIVWYLIGSVVLAMEINIEAWTDAFTTAELGKFGEKNKR